MILGIEGSTTPVSLQTIRSENLAPSLVTENSQVEGTDKPTPSGQDASEPLRSSEATMTRPAKWWRSSKLILVGPIVGILILWLVGLSLVVSNDLMNAEPEESESSASESS